MKLTIVGLGLMGGSMALALRRRGGYTVRGIDVREAVVSAALACGAIAQGGTEPGVLTDSDVVMLCMPPQRQLDFLEQHASKLRPGTLLTDVTGVKCGVMAPAAALLPAGVRYLPGHPMAGREQGGWENAVETLFDGRHYILTPTEGAQQADIALLERLALDLGCRDVVITTPEEHDARIAFTSQLMHVIAVSLCDDPMFLKSSGFEGGSLQDVTRVANLDAALWSELFSFNRGALCASIDEAIQNLQAYRDCIARAPRADIERKLASSAARKREVLHGARED